MDGWIIAYKVGEASGLRVIYYSLIGVEEPVGANLGQCEHNA